MSDKEEYIVLIHEDGQEIYVSELSARALCCTLVKDKAHHFPKNIAEKLVIMITELLDFKAEIILADDDTNLMA